MSASVFGVNLTTMFLETDVSSAAVVNVPVMLLKPLLDWVEGIFCRFVAPLLIISKWKVVYRLFNVLV